MFGWTGSANVYWPIASAGISRSRVSGPIEIGALNTTCPEAAVMSSPCGTASLLMNRITNGVVRRTVEIGLLELPRRTAVSTSRSDGAPGALADTLGETVVVGLGDAVDGGPVSGPSAPMCRVPDMSGWTGSENAYRPAASAGISRSRVSGPTNGLPVNTTSPDAAVIAWARLHVDQADDERAVERTVEVGLVERGIRRCQHEQIGRYRHETTGAMSGVALEQHAGRDGLRRSGRLRVRPGEAARRRMRLHRRTYGRRRWAVCADLAEDRIDEVLGSVDRSGRSHAARVRSRSRSVDHQRSP